MNKNIFCFWNNSQYVKNFDHLFHNIILDERSRKLSDFVNLYEAGGMVILAELDWESEMYSNFYGFEILCCFRAEYRLKCPIAICSFMSESYLLKKFPILQFPQHHPFIRLPVRPETIVEKIKQAEFTDEYRLNDIIISYCDPIGRLVKLITHGKGFRQILKDQVNESIFSKCITDLTLLKNYMRNKNLNKEVLTTGENLVKKLTDIITAKDFKSLITIKSDFEYLLQMLKK